MENFIFCEVNRAIDQTTDQLRINHYQCQNRIPDSKQILHYLILKNFRYNLIQFNTLILFLSKVCFCLHWTYKI